MNEFDENGDVSVYFPQDIDMAGEDEIEESEIEKNEIPVSSIPENVESRKFPITTIFERYKKLSGGQELDDAQRTRLMNVMDAFGVETVLDFEYMLLLHENYLHLNNNRFVKNSNFVNESLKEIESLVRDRMGIHLPENFMQEAEKVGIKAIEGSIKKVDAELMGSVRLAQNIQTVIRDSMSELDTVPQKVQADISAMLLKVVEEEMAKKAVKDEMSRKAFEEAMSKKSDEAQWFESVRRNALFLLSFGFFGLFFFFAGVLSYGKGLPDWVVGVFSPEASWGNLFLSCALGLPMSWILWIGGLFLSGLWFYENRKRMSRVTSFIAYHAVSVIVGFFVLVAAIYFWFF